MPRSTRLNKLWMSEFRDWLTSPPPFSTATDEFWCKYCKVCIKAKKYNVQLHSKSKRHTQSQERDNLPISSFINVENKGLEKQKAKLKEEAPVKHKIVQTSASDTSAADVNLMKIQKNINSNQVSFIISRRKAPETTSSDDIDRLLDDVTLIFRRDLRSFLQKNGGVVKPIMENPDFFEGQEGLSRLTKMLVGYMSQHYLIEYTQESYKGANSPCKKKTLSEKLNAIEEMIKKSVAEMQNVKAQLESRQELEQSSMTHEEISLDAEHRRKSD